MEVLVFSWGLKVDNLFLPGGMLLKELVMV